MCGRVLLTSSGQELAEAFELAAVPDLQPRYNIAPSQDVPTVSGADAERRALSRRWGLVPAWAKDPAVGNRMINARSETAASKPAFRDALRRRRCIVPADGFYEWSARGSDRQPHWFRLRDGRIMAMAGLWERWREPSGQTLQSFTILTTTANDAVRDVHDRMPVLLDRKDFGLWLDPDIRDVEQVSPLLAPCPADWMESRLVGLRVNNPRFDDPECLEPPTEYQPSLF